MRARGWWESQSEWFSKQYLRHRSQCSVLIHQNLSNCLSWSAIFLPPTWRLVETLAETKHEITLCVQRDILTVKGWSRILSGRAALRGISTGNFNWSPTGKIEIRPICPSFLSTLVFPFWPMNDGSLFVNLLRNTSLVYKSISTQSPIISSVRLLV